jgi:hypothetical protein
MNTGIQDAYNLAWKLALVARGRAAHSLLDSYETERRAVAKDVIKTTRMMTERSEAFGHLSPAERERLYVNVVVPEVEARRMAQHMEELESTTEEPDLRRARARAPGNGPGPERALDAGPLRRGTEQLSLSTCCAVRGTPCCCFPGPGAGGPAGSVSRASPTTRSAHGALIDIHLVRAHDAAPPPARLR